MPDRSPSEATVDLAGYTISGTVEAFRTALRDWFVSSARQLPWRESKDPYRIWLSEVILQQTRVNQAIPYYLRFVEAFPSIHALAGAPLDDVLKQWEGLGYYSRARNLHKAAKYVIEQHDGQIPKDRKSLIELPGIGSYTAAAILSIAFGKPYAVLDGNVIRVLARLTTFEPDVRQSRSRAFLQQLADKVLDSDNPGSFNESMMELGATMCTPRNPTCPVCPVRKFCRGAVSGNPEAYPQTARKKPVPHFDIAVAVLNNERGEYYVQRRPENGLLGGLWEFPGGKKEPGETLEEACRREIKEELGIDVSVGRRVATIKHAYSHFRITLHAFECSPISETPMLPQNQPYEWIAADQFADYAFPRANRKLIELLTDMTGDRIT